MATAAAAISAPQDFGYMRLWQRKIAGIRDEWLIFYIMPPEIIRKCERVIYRFKIYL